MTCPKCRGPAHVMSTTKVEGGSVAIRIRRCTSSKCGWSFSTTERRCDYPDCVRKQQK